MEKTTIKKFTFTTVEGEEVELQLPYSFDIYVGNRDLMMGQIIYELMNKIKTLEDKIKRTSN